MEYTNGIYKRILDFAIDISKHDIDLKKNMIKELHKY